MFSLRALSSREDTAFCYAMDMHASHIYQPVPLWRHKSYESISTSTKTRVIVKRKKPRPSPLPTQTLRFSARSPREENTHKYNFPRPRAAKCSRINPLSFDIFLTVSNLFASLHDNANGNMTAVSVIFRRVLKNTFCWSN